MNTPPHEPHKLILPMTDWDREAFELIAKFLHSELDGKVAWSGSYTGAQTSYPPKALRKIVIELCESIDLEQAEKIFSQCREIQQQTGQLVLAPTIES